MISDVGNSASEKSVTNASLAMLHYLIDFVGDRLLIDLLCMIFKQLHPTCGCPAAGYILKYINSIRAVDGCIRWRPACRACEWK